MVRRSRLAFGAAAMLWGMFGASGTVAQTARDLLTQAAFHDRDRGVALKRIDQACRAATTILTRTPDDGEAAITHATALGYRAKLTGSRSDAIDARKQFEALVARDPRNPETQAALGAWHVGAIVKLGRLIGRAAVGAQKAVGLAALDRAVKLSGNRAMFSGLSALLRLELDPSDPRARRLAEVASRAAAPTALDRQMQRAAIAILVPLGRGDHEATRILAHRLLPLGRVSAGS